MTTPWHTAVAVMHTLSPKQVAALVELYLGRELTAHPKTITALFKRELINRDEYGTPYLEDLGREVAGELLPATPDEVADVPAEDVSDTPPLSDEEAEDFELKFGVVLTPEGHQPPHQPDEAEPEDDGMPEVELTDDEIDALTGDDEPEDDGMPETNDENIESEQSSATFFSQALDELMGSAQPLTAAHQVICRPRRSGEHSQLIAVVVGSESDAQRVADQWNLTHIADIAGRADATYAVAVPAEVGVYLFERFAVVEHP